MTQRIEALFVAAGKYHDIDFARLELLKLFAEHPRARVTVAPDYAPMADWPNKFDFLVTYTCDLMPTVEETNAIKAWLEAGGRWLALHGTNSILRFTETGVDAPDERPDVMALLGTQFVAHPPIGPFTVEIVDRDDPLIGGIEDFEVVDELYLSRPTAAVRTLAQTRFAGEATGFVEQDWAETAVPIIYTRDVGQGRVVYNTLGHCRGHYDLPGMQDFYPHPERCAWNYPVYYELLRRGLRWAAGET